MKLGNKGGMGGTILALLMFMFACLFILEYMGVTHILSTASGVGDNGTPYCDTDVTPDLDINCYDEYATGTAITEATNVRRVMGDPNSPWTVWTCGTEQTDLIYGATYEFIVGTSTSDFTGNAVGPYFTHKIKCQSDEELNKAVNNDEDASGLTSTFYNKNHGTTYQAVGSGGSATIYIEYQAAANEVYGNKFIGQSAAFSNHGAHRTKYSNILQLPIDTANFTVPNWVKIYDGPEAGTVLNQVNCPLTAVNAAGYVNYCYEAPVIDETAVQIAIDLQAATGVTPTNDISAHLWPCSVYIDSDTSKLEWGCENEDNAAVGIAEASVETTTVDCTA